MQIRESGAKLALSFLLANKTPHYFFVKLHFVWFVAANPTIGGNKKGMAKSQKNLTKKFTTNEKLGIIT